MSPGQPASEMSLTARAATAFQAYRGGDVLAMSELVDLLTPVLWQTARSQHCEHEVAEDAIATAWLRLVEGQDRIRDAQAILGWLVVTVKREVWRSTGAARRLRTDDDLSARADTGPDPETMTVLSERQRVVWRHVERLTDRCRELLRVIAFCDRPDYAAVSEALGMPLGSIGPTRGRCLSKLRASLLADSGWEA